MRTVRDLAAPATGRDIPLRAYEPLIRAEKGGLVFAHGGGWVLGSIELADPLCRALAHAARCVVVSIGYRLAPEHPFPAAVEDAYEALTWVSAHARHLGIDPDRLAIGGDSAGGNLAAATTRMAAQRGGPPIRLQLLLYPPLDPACELQSHRRYREGYGLTSEQMRWLWRHYLGERRRLDPLATPLRSALPPGLAPAVVVVAECDVLRSEVETYADLLVRAGVGVELLRYRGQVHAFLSYGGWIEQAQLAVEEIGAATHAALKRG